MRTESKSFQVHPQQEQYYIDVMQEFHWNLKSTQEVKVKDSHLETRNNNVYNVTTTEHYIKLAFERPYEFPNRDKLVALESEFFGMIYEKKSKFAAAIIVPIIAGIVFSIAVHPAVGIILMAAGMGLWIFGLVKRNQRVGAQHVTNDARKKQILAECSQLTAHIPSTPVYIAEPQNTSTQSNIFCSGCGKKYEAAAAPNFCTDCGGKIK